MTVVAATLSDNVVTAGANGTPTPATQSSAGGGAIYNLGDGSLARLSIISSIIANSSSGATDCASSSSNSGTTNVTGNNSLIENNKRLRQPGADGRSELGAVAG